MKQDTKLDLPFLLSAPGQDWLSQLATDPPTEQTHLKWAERLRATMGQAEAHALLETAMLRGRAQAKFTRANQMYFDRAGLEMASAERISVYRAERYAPFGVVADLGCGIGGDAIGLVVQNQQCRVAVVDVNEARLSLAQENVRVYGGADRLSIHQADLTGIVPFKTDALFFDPARRDERGKRIFSLANYRPPLSVLDRWRPITENWGVKVSPAVNYDEIPADAEVEFVSVGGELREAVLWFGQLRDGVSRRATLLLADGSAASCVPANLDASVGVSEPHGFLFEPDSAVIRAQLVQDVAHQLGASLIDPTIAYLTADARTETLLGRWFTVTDWFPFQLKRLRSYLRERDIGALTVKKRGSALEPDWVRGQLRLRGSKSATIFLTRYAGDPIVIVSL